MFGPPSFQKLLVLAGIIMAVVYFFRWVGKMKETRDQEDRLKGRKTQGKKTFWQRSAGKKAEKDAEALSMAACSVCGTYVSPGARPCDRPDCPL